MTNLQANLTDDQKRAFGHMRNADNVVLIDGSFEGQPAAIVAAVYHDEAREDAMFIVPLYIEITRDMAKRINDAEGSKPVPVDTKEERQQLNLRMRPANDLRDEETDAVAHEARTPPSRKLDS